MPLWEKLRPGSLAGFVGIDLGWLEGYEGSVIFTGPFGCGKTSAALALTSRLLGKPCALGDNCWPTSWTGELGSFASYHVGSRMDIKTLRHWTDNALVFGRRVILIDEAHQLSKKLQSELLTAIEEPASRNTYLLCTAEIEKLSEPLRDRCTIVEMAAISGGNREALVDRAWQTAAPGTPQPPSLLLALEQYQISSPRVILDVVEEVAAGNPPLEATKKRAKNKKLQPKAKAASATAPDPTMF